MPVNILLYRIEHPGNLGSICRIAKNFAFDDIILVEPQCGITPEGRRMAKHANDLLDSLGVIGEDDLCGFDVLVMTHGRECDGYNMVRSMITPREFTSRLQETSLREQKVGILFGPEGEGLPPEMLRRADVVLSIPTSREYSSMNLAMSVGIVLYELSLLESGEDRITEPFEPMTRKEREVVMGLVDELIGGWEFKIGKREETMQMVWRRMLGRSFLTKREAYALMGFLKRCLGRR